MKFAVNSLRLSRASATFNMCFLSFSILKIGANTTANIEIERAKWQKENIVLYVVTTKKHLKQIWTCPKRHSIAFRFVVHNVFIWSFLPILLKWTWPSQNKNIMNLRDLVDIAHHKSHTKAVKLCFCHSRCFPFCNVIYFLHQVVNYTRISKDHELYWNADKM